MPSTSSGPVDGDARSTHFNRISVFVLEGDKTTLAILPSVLTPGHTFPSIPVQIYPQSSSPPRHILSALVLVMTMTMMVRNMIRSGTISAQLGRVLILYHYLFKSVVIRLLNPSLICSFHLLISVAYLATYFILYLELSFVIVIYVPWSHQYDIPFSAVNEFIQRQLLMSWQPTISQPFLAVHQGPWCVYELGHLFSYRSSK